MGLYVHAEAEVRCAVAAPARRGAPDELVDRLGELLPREAGEDAMDGLRPKEIAGPGGLLTQLARVIETALGAELTERLGYPPRPGAARAGRPTCATGRRPRR